MITAKSIIHANKSSLSSLRPVNEVAATASQAKKDEPKTLEFKFTPSMDRITKSDAVLTGTYNNKGKLALISNKMIVYVEPSAYIRDKLVPNYKAVI